MDHEVRLFIKRIPTIIDLFRIWNLFLYIVVRPIGIHKRT